jgi:hypothetical protein
VDTIQGGLSIAFQDIKVEGEKEEEEEEEEQEEERKRNTVGQGEIDLDLAQPSKSTREKSSRGREGSVVPRGKVKVQLPCRRETQANTHPPTLEVARWPHQ